MKALEKKGFLRYLLQNHYDGIYDPDTCIVEGDTLVPEREYDYSNGYVGLVQNEELIEVPNFFSLREVAEIFDKYNLHMADDKIRRFCKKGIFRYYRIGNNIYMSEDDLERNVTRLIRYGYVPFRLIRAPKKK